MVWKLQMCRGPYDRGLNMEERETEVARPFCYGCHRRIDGNASIMANRRFVFPLHESCFYGYINEFRRKAPVLQERVQGEENARLAN